MCLSSFHNITFLFARRSYVIFTLFRSLLLTMASPLSPVHRTLSNLVAVTSRKWGGMIMTPVHNQRSLLWKHLNGTSRDNCQ